jgi:hypothetical protein
VQHQESEIPAELGRLCNWAAICRLLLRRTLIRVRLNNLRSVRRQIAARFAMKI